MDDTSRMITMTMAKPINVSLHSSSCVRCFFLLWRDQGTLLHATGQIHFIYFHIFAKWTTAEIRLRLSAYLVGNDTLNTFFHVVSDDCLFATTRHSVTHHHHHHWTSLWRCGCSVMMMMADVSNSDCHDTQNTTLYKCWRLCSHYLQLVSTRLM